MPDQPTPYSDDEVHELADAITEAHLAGIMSGASTLARWLLDRSWRKTEAVSR